MPENSTVLPLKVVMDKCSDARGERGGGDTQRCPSQSHTSAQAPWRRGSSAGCRGWGQNCFPAQEASPARWGLPLPPMGQLHWQGHMVGDIEPEPVSHWQPPGPESGSCQAGQPSSGGTQVICHKRVYSSPQDQILLPATSPVPGTGQTLMNHCWKS